MRLLSHARPAACALAVIVAAGSAQARPFAPALLCQQIMSVIAAQGAVVLSTSPTTYDRYVRDGSFCLPGQVTESDYVQARDAAACPVYRCMELEFRYLR
jgi:hypothetical protein